MYTVLYITQHYSGISQCHVCSSQLPPAKPHFRREFQWLGDKRTRWQGAQHFHPSLRGVRWQLINANTDLHISPTSQANSRESTAACAQEGFGSCKRISAQHCTLHRHCLLAAALHHSKEHRYVSGSQCPVPAATLLLIELFPLSGNATFFSPPAFFHVKAQGGDFVEPLCDLLKEMRNSCRYRSNKE